jgi:myo-inositol catabolism protein IolS
MVTKQISGDMNYNVSAIGFGCAAIGGYDYGTVNEKNSLNAINEAWNCGINFFDISDIYGFGYAESILSSGLGVNRKDAIIASKFGLRKNSLGNIVRDCSLKWLEEALHASLQRLNIEQIPIYLIHWYDEKTPLDELINALIKYKSQGKIGRFGVSNFSQEQYYKFCTLGGENNLQLPFSLVDTSFAGPLQKASKEKNSLTMAYDVLGRGILTGKYTTSSTFSGTDTRSTHKYFQDKNLIKNLKLVEKLKDIAENNGVSSAQVAIRWVFDMNFIDVVLIGCKTPEQVLTNVNIFDFNLSDIDRNILSELAS